jgi:hypothetical protein
MDTMLKGPTEQGHPKEKTTTPRKTWEEKRKA